MEDEGVRVPRTDGRLGGQGLGTEEFDRLLQQARDTLASTRRATTATDVSGLGAAEAVGEALNGLVRAVANADGTLSDLTLDPRVLRVSLTDVADGVRQAVNVALAEARAAAQPTLPDDVPQVDLDALGERIERIQSESLRQMATFSQTINETLQQMRRR
ncbi:DNA-binding protein YbaB [Micromonospora luteifusca]|uniref:DNA-binding protein YbaB n=1 Tax=Micromonospora luteifusca TaxID=709860 RepID=A0ABS2LXI3_9ACTN|nr:YbaB/EbfC family nucleoid-associated protein [Micromonospora luteifusca]MBM7492518.1 DNA-binding protein YbaB [Micromonospora luteifusca]